MLGTQSAPLTHTREDTTARYTKRTLICGCSCSVRAYVSSIVPTRIPMNWGAIGSSTPASTSDCLEGDCNRFYSSVGGRSLAALLAPVAASPALALVRPVD